MELPNNTASVRIIDALAPTIRNPRLITPRIAETGTRLYNEGEGFFLVCYTDSEGKKRLGVDFSDLPVDIVAGKKSPELTREIDAMGRCLSALGFSRRNSEHARNWNYSTFVSGLILVASKVEGKGKNKKTVYFVSEKKEENTLPAIGFAIKAKEGAVSVPVIETKVEETPTKAKAKPRTRKAKAKPETAPSVETKVEGEGETKVEGETGNPSA